MPDLAYPLPMLWHRRSSLFWSFRRIVWRGNAIGRGLLAGAVLFPPVASAAAPSRPSGDNSEILGTWEGESKCTVPDSPCHDEHVIYEIAVDQSVPGGFKMDGYKVVSGRRVSMGTLHCAYEAAKKALSCTSRGKDSDDWEYTFSGDTLRGTLTINGKTLYRQVTTRKVTAHGR